MANSSKGHGRYSDRMGAGTYKNGRRLDDRIKEFDARVSLGNQTPGGSKIASMMHRPGSQNRNK